MGIIFQMNSLGEQCESVQHSYIFTHILVQLLTSSMYCCDLKFRSLMSKASIVPEPAK